MAKYLLEGSGVNWLAILALITFFIVFALALVMVFARKGDSYAGVARQPLEDSYPLPDETQLS